MGKEEFRIPKPKTPEEEIIQAQKELDEIDQRRSAMGLPLYIEDPNHPDAIKTARLHEKIAELQEKIGREKAESDPEEDISRRLAA